MDEYRGKLSIDLGSRKVLNVDPHTRIFSNVKQQSISVIKNKVDEE